MKRILLLTWRYIAFNRLKTAILIACLTIVLFLPIAVHLLLRFYEDDLYARAKATPLVFGARGDRFDLVLKSLYFTGDSPGSVTAEDLDRLRVELEEGNLGSAIPLQGEFTAAGHPIVGTTLDYLEFRKLTVEKGTMPLVLGDAVLGADAARELEAGVGSAVLTDQTSLYNLAAVYRVKLNITGILAPSGTADDRAVFCDLKTAWIIAGIGHGHTELTGENRKDLLMQGPDGEMIVKPSVTAYTEITAENIDSFHFHAPREKLPLTSILTLPRDQKSATIITARYAISGTKQILRPETVVAELMRIVLQVKRFFDANFLLVALAVVLFLILVVMLSLKIRERERLTLFRIGCAKSTVFWVQVTELLLVLGVSLTLAAILGWIAMVAAPNLIYG